MRINWIMIVVLGLASVFGGGCRPPEKPDQTEEINAAIAQAERAMHDDDYVLALELLRNALQMNAPTQGQALRIQRLSEEVIGRAIHELDVEHTPPPPPPATPF